MLNNQQLNAIYGDIIQHRNLMLTVSNPAWEEFCDALARFAIAQNEQTIAGLALAHENYIRAAHDQVMNQINQPHDDTHRCPMCFTRTASDGLCVNCDANLQKEQRGYY